MSTRLRQSPPHQPMFPLPTKSGPRDPQTETPVCVCRYACMFVLRSRTGPCLRSHKQLLTQLGPGPSSCDQPHRIRPRPLLSVPPFALILPPHPEVRLGGGCSAEGGQRQDLEMPGEDSRWQQHIVEWCGGSSQSRRGCRFATFFVLKTWGFLPGEIKGHLCVLLLHALVHPSSPRGHLSSMSPGKSAISTENGKGTPKNGREAGATICLMGEPHF